MRGYEYPKGTDTFVQEMDKVLSSLPLASWAQFHMGNNVVVIEEETESRTHVPMEPNPRPAPVTDTDESSQAPTS